MSPPIILRANQNLMDLPSHQHPDPMCLYAATGHRSEEHHNTAANGWPLTKLAHYVLQRERPTAIISGMALGWDLAIADAALQLQIPLCCAIPCPEQTKSYSAEQILRWANARNNCKWLHVTSQSYYPGVFLKRDEWMVFNAKRLLSLLDPLRPLSGTSHTIAFAKALGVKSLNCWPMWRGDLKKLGLWLGDK